MEEQQFFTDTKSRKWYLHAKVTKKGATLRYFSLNQANAIPLPTDCDIIVARSGLPFLRKISS